MEPALASVRNQTEQADTLYVSIADGAALPPFLVAAAGSGIEIVRHAGWVMLVCGMGGGGGGSAHEAVCARARIPACVCGRRRLSPIQTAEPACSCASACVRMRAFVCASVCVNRGGEAGRFGHH